MHEVQSSTATAVAGTTSCGLHEEQVGRDLRGQVQLHISHRMFETVIYSTCLRNLRAPSLSTSKQRFQRATTSASDTGTVSWLIIEALGMDWTKKKINNMNCNHCIHAVGKTYRSRTRRTSSASGSMSLPSRASRANTPSMSSHLRKRT